MLRSMIVLALVTGSVALSAQRSGDFWRPSDVWCADASRGNRNDRVTCDVREESLGNVPSLDIDTGGNGGISVRGTGGSAPRLRFRVVARGSSDADAQDIARQIEISTSDGRVRVKGPKTSGREGWSVDVEVETPRDLPLTLASTNGGIDIQDVAGRTRFETVNGGVTLSNVSGDMRGRTVNGGLNVRLDGQRWEGSGLDVQTTNGGVRMSMPEGYSAELTAETSNGGLVVDFPITVQGRISDVNHRISATLGSGGPPLQVRTVNGGVNIARR